MTTTTTTTQLAFVTSEHDSDSDNCDAYADRVGGRPVFIDPAVPAPASLSRCAVCARPLFLLVQICAARPRCPDRLLYVWACNSRSCAGLPGSCIAVRAHRPKSRHHHELKKEKEKEKEKERERERDTDRSQPQNPPKFKLKTDAGLRDDESMNASLKSKDAKTTTGEKTTAGLPFAFGAMDSFFGGESSGWGDDDDGDNFASNSKNDESTNTASAIPPSVLEATTTTDIDEITALLAARDKRYAWGDDEGSSDGAKVMSYAKAATPKKKKNAKSTASTPVQSANTPAAADPGPADAIAALKARRSADAKVWAHSPSFPSFYLEFDDEREYEDSYEHEMRLLEEYKRAETFEEEIVEAEDGDGGGGASWAGETYEKVRPKFYNKAFKRFQKTVEAEPTQCIRYEFNGTPVFYSTDSVHQALSTSGPPACTRCGGPRVFEMQLMPAILTVLPTELEAMKTRKREEEEAAAKALEETTKEDGAQDPSPQPLPTPSSSRAQESTPSKSPRKHAAASSSPNSSMNINNILSELSLGLEFGTILVYTCERDCEAHSADDDPYFVEHAAFQKEIWKSG